MALRYCLDVTKKHTLFPLRKNNVQTGIRLERNLSEAAVFYEKAARSGLGEAQIGLAMLYARGGGVELDPNKALIWLEMAVAGGASVPKPIYELLRSNSAPKQ